MIVGPHFDSKPNSFQPLAMARMNSFAALDCCYAVEAQKLVSVSLEGSVG
jgi:hypothetical protein